MKKTKKLAHIGDIQIRRGSRHDEYRQVFDRLYKDLKKEKPDRIYLAGDIFHNKVDMSPTLILLTSDFFTKLSEIAPVDIIPGNHDLNLSQLSQGDTNLSIVYPLYNGVVVKNGDEVDYWKKYDGRNGIYYFPESGFYDIADDLVYGHYSCIDEQMLTLTEKEEGKTYVAFFHGQVYECMNDNGTVNRDTTLMKVSAFNGFDIVAMGDIHEHQSFREDESMSYSGSLVQQGYGESLEKGYLIWDLKKMSFRKKYIPNDYGFAKVSISHGELWEERLENMQFSNDKEKTKVYVEWEDYEENYSKEKEDQIVRYIKTNYGCRVITVTHKSILRDADLAIEDGEAEDALERNFNEVLGEYLNDNIDEFDIEEDFIVDLLAFSKVVEEDLDIVYGKDYSNITWNITSMEVCNLFSYGDEPIKFDFDKLSGLTGIFGANYSGKTNFIKSLMWGLFQHILGGGDAKKLVNIYTSNDRAYVNIYINLGGEKIRILRSVKNKLNEKTGVIKTDYGVTYEKWIEDPSTGVWKWESEQNDKKTNIKSAVKEQVIDAIGTPGDFAKVNLQSENGKDNYLNSEQQSKNNVIKKFLGLQDYSDRYDYVKKNHFNEIAREQKRMGNINDIYEELKEVKDNLVVDTGNFNKLKGEKKEISGTIELINNEVIDSSAKLQELEHIRINSVEEVERKISDTKKSLEENKGKIAVLEEWLGKNFKKEMPEEISESMNTLVSNLSSKKDALKDKGVSYRDGEKWINDNPEKEESDTTEWENEIEKLNTQINEKKLEISKYENMLPSFRGENCPTCGHEQKEAQPDKEKGCINYIAGLNDGLVKLNSSVTEFKVKISTSSNNAKHNVQLEKAKAKLGVLKTDGQLLKSEVDEIERKVKVLDMSKDLIENNKNVDLKSSEVKSVRNSIDSSKDLLVEFSETIIKINKNKEKEKVNEKLNEGISTNKEKLSELRITLENIDRQMVTLNGDISVNKKSIENYDNKLDSIKEQEKRYKLYRIYLACTHRDGIPASIIRKKLPAVNSKIGSILKDIVEYNLELYLDKKGDIKETFYYNEDKSDSLPMDSSSGAQGFLANLAIRDALHYASKLPKSSMCIIDEGFGKLDADITINMEGPLLYLKNKYKNVFVVTHTDTVKDFMDNIMLVSKSKKGISAENQQKYPDGWTTQISLK